MAALILPSISSRNGAVYDSTDRRERACLNSEAPARGRPLGRLKESSHESCEIVGIRWAVGVQRYTDADDCTRRSPSQGQEYRRQSYRSCRGLWNGKTDTPDRTA